MHGQTSPENITDRGDVVDLAAWGAFLVAAFALTGSPGPNTLSAAAVGAAFGKRRGFPYMLGLNAGVGVVIVIVATGLSGAFLALPGVAPVISFLALAYFLYLAWKIATAPPLALQTADMVGAAPRFSAGVFQSLVNPKAYAAMASLLSGHTLSAQASVVDVLIKAMALIVVIFIVNFAWLTIGVSLSRFMQKPETARPINLAFAVLLVLSVVFVLMR